MYGKAFMKHIREFRRYILNHQYEQTEHGIYAPLAHAHIGGYFVHADAAGNDLRCDPNIVPNEGLSHFLSVCLKSGSQITSWYLALYATAYTPVAALTAATFTATTGEIVSGTEGYSEATRVLWVGDAVDTTNTEVTNLASPAAFTIVTATSLVVNGAGMLSVSAKGGTTGTLVSAARFSAQRTFANTDVFNLKYKVDADAA